MLLCNVADEVLTRSKKSAYTVFFLVVASAYFINITLDLRKDTSSYFSMLCVISHKTRECSLYNLLTELVHCDSTMKRK